MGDFELSSSSDGGLAEFAEKLRRLSTNAASNQINQAAADAVKERVELEFERAEDPYGNKWKDTVRGNHPLTGETRDLRTSVKVEITGKGFVILVTDWKAIFHQGGTRRGIPARPMLPVGGKLPDTWSYAMDLAVRGAIADILDVSAG